MSEQRLRQSSTLFELGQSYQNYGFELVLKHNADAVNSLYRRISIAASPNV